MALREILKSIFAKCWHVAWCLRGLIEEGAVGRHGSFTWLRNKPVVVWDGNSSLLMIDKSHSCHSWLSLLSCSLDPPWPSSFFAVLATSVNPVFFLWHHFNFQICHCFPRLGKTHNSPNISAAARRPFSFSLLPKLLIPTFYAGCLRFLTANSLFSLRFSPLYSIEMAVN